MTLGLGLLALSLTAFPLAGQPYTLDQDLKPLEITLRDHPDAPGVRWAGADGVLGEAPQHVFVRGLSASSASEVFVIAPRLEDRLELNVAKDNWGEDLKSCDTGDQGRCFVGFRTFGDAGFTIAGPAGAPWQLIVLTSPELPLDAVVESPLFAADRKDADRYEGGGTAGVPGASGGMKWLGPTSVALLVVIAVLLVLILRRRSAPPATVGLALLLTWLALAPMSLFAQPGFGGNLRGGGAAWERTDLEDLQERAEEASRSSASRAEAGRLISSSAGHIQETYDEVSGHAKKLLSLKDLAESWGNLSTCSAMRNPPGMPRVPSFCADDAACQGCYLSARQRFNQVRATFQQLQTIYTCTKNFTDKAIAFGDGGSAVHGVTALAWQGERLKIEKSVEKLQEAYDQKYLQLVGDLQSAMIGLSNCEAQFGVEDWYDRFGYMYFEFMRDKYRRSG